MILAVAHQKGGTGKSTLAICIASELSARGQNVLLVDADPQQTAQTWHDLAVEKAEKAEKDGDSSTPNGQPPEARGHVLPSVVSMTGTLHRDNQLPKLANSYDVVVVDTPPRLGPTLKSALVVADVALIPCGPTGP